MLILAEKLSMLINMKMPTIVGIFIFISRENFMLSRVSMNNFFLTSGPGINIYMFLIRHFLFLFFAEMAGPTVPRCIRFQFYDGNIYNKLV